VPGRYARSHGLADVSAGVPADDRTLWYVASTSKSLTGFGVALLAHQGAVRFDAPITTLLPDARWHPMDTLRTRLAAARRNVTATDSVRAARRRQPLGRPLADFVGSYSAPAFGTVEITAAGGGLAYRWGALYGPAEVYDAAKAEWRVELAGSGEVMRFAFDGPGAARALTVEGTTFVRAP